MVFGTQHTQNVCENGCSIGTICLGVKINQSSLVFLATLWNLEPWTKQQARPDLTRQTNMLVSALNLSQTRSKQIAVLGKIGRQRYCTGAQHWSCGLLLGSTQLNRGVVTKNVLPASWSSRLVSETKVSPVHSHVVPLHLLRIYIYIHTHSALKFCSFYFTVSQLHDVFSSTILQAGHHFLTHLCWHQQDCVWKEIIKEIAQTTHLSQHRQDPAWKWKGQSGRSEMLRSLPHVHVLDGRCTWSSTDYRQ
jgi:hypothetical protein